MNIMSRTPINRGHSSKPLIDYIHIQQQSPSFIKGQKQSSKQLKSSFNHHVNKINFTADLNTTTRVQTNPVYDSRKQQMKDHNLDDWKILTLKQIKRNKNILAKQQRENSLNKSQQKIHVSISKSNRSSSKERNCQTPSKIQVIPNNYKHLDSLSKKNYILQRFSNQIQVESKQVAFFCQ